MKRYKLKPLNEIKETTYYQNSINESWRRGIVEMSMFNHIITDDNKTFISDKETIFVLTPPNGSCLPDTFLIEVDESYIPEKSKYRRFDPALESYLLEELQMEYLEEYYTYFLSDCYVDDSEYVFIDGEEGDYGITYYYDLLGNPICKRNNLGGDQEEYYWDKDFLSKAQVRVVEAQKEYTESRFKHYLMTLQEEKLK
jgi:hypothetical protein